MLNSLKSFLKEITLGKQEKLPYQDDDHRLAAAALMFHIIAVDGEVETEELSALNKTLKNAYSLSEEETDNLIKLAKERDDEAVDLYGFTSVLKRQLSEEERVKVIEMMWEMVFADGSVHEFEDNTIWRVAELLGVSSRQRMELKKQVSERHQQ
ncbi:MULTISPECIES: TerB family tellurite resistance protein [Pseudovibrio]|uniref:tellurite resistance TerB family protein n=1 Tax=Stappiaceae TaxID=2821832 RepID=UPI0023667500|nr:MULTISPECIES: TerB family tellurite resistance protein [Pseudovibrio]MDD7911770.1 TerB family tellurite resistance protein [Pseudovibrio exalbescens]MDX5594781.1 TerB family tellurite resistance protein [Pseudovibrio sp. SPO723]